MKVKIGSDIAQRNLFRVIYAYSKEKQEIFIELFSKSEKENSDNFSNCTQEKNRFLLFFCFSKN